MLLLLTIPPWIFLNFMLAQTVIQFCAGDVFNSPWWGFPLWMTFWIIWLPLFVGGIGLIAWASFS